MKNEDNLWNEDDLHDLKNKGKHTNEKDPKWRLSQNNYILQNKDRLKNENKCKQAGAKLGQAQDKL